MDANLKNYFNDEGIKTACDRLHLTPEQLHQQADLCNRLLHMATHGVPTPATDAPITRPVLVLHALITAYLALGSTNRELTDEAARLALAVSHELTLQQELRLQRETQKAVTRTFAAAPAAAY